MARKALSKKIRFEVFKRDSFTCQYCGRKAPDVVLHCDHIKPVAEGGTNDILNLITSCFDCNSGKSKREISDHAALNKQMAQMTAINERRQQIEMMAEWRSELEKIDQSAALMAEEAWHRAIEHCAQLTEIGQKNLAGWIRKYGLEAVFNGISGSCNSYLRRDDDGRFSMDSIGHAFSMIPRVMSVQRKAKDKPYLQRLFYARGILRNRLSYLNERIVMQIMEDAVSWGADAEKIIDLCTSVRSWSEFRETLDGFIDAQREAAEGSDGANS